MSDMTNLDGTRTSEELVRLVEDREARREMAALAIERAVKKRGMSPDLARRLYGVP